MVLGPEHFATLLRTTRFRSISDVDYARKAATERPKRSRVGSLPPSRHLKPKPILTGRGLVFGRSNKPQNGLSESCVAPPRGW